jgi:serine/threonine protein phosphatase 1
LTPFLYAIGDVHGHARLLVSLLDAIRQHAGDEAWRVVFIGDYIDRGPDSAGVLSIAQDLHADGRAVCLLGNHERVLLDAVSDPVAMERWMKLSGATTLASFGTDTIAGIPRDVIDWLTGLPTFHEDALRYYVHAGLSPERPLQEQTDHDRLWMRGRFLTEEHDFGKFIVHGHTPQMTGQPDLHPYRVNLDTAVGQTGILTAGIFDQTQGAPTGFLHAHAS